MAKKNAVDLSLKRRIFLGGAVKGIDSEKKQIRAYASTNDWDRYGEKFEADAFKEGLGDYQKNPVVLWAHDYSAQPVAKTVGYEFDSKGLILTMEFADTAQAQEIFALYEGGFLSAFSVGFKPVEVAYEERSAGGEMGLVYKKALLLENSCVPVPANPGAVVLKGIGGKEITLAGELVRGFWERSEIGAEKPATAVDVRDSNAQTMGEALSYVEKAIKVLSGHKSEYLSHDDHEKALKHMGKAKDIMTASAEPKSAAPAPDLKESLEYLIDLSKTVKGKVTDEGIRGLLIQATNVCRELVLGPGAVNLETGAGKLTEDEAEALVREFEMLSARLMGGDMSDEDRKELAKIGEQIENLISGK